MPSLAILPGVFFLHTHSRAARRQFGQRSPTPVEYTMPPPSAGAALLGRFFLVGDTEFKDFISVGDQVKIHVIVNADGTFTIREIEKTEGLSGNDNSNDDNGNDDNGNDDNSNDDDDDDGNGNDDDSGDNGNDD